MEDGLFDFARCMAYVAISSFYINTATGSLWHREICDVGLFNHAQETAHLLPFYMKIYMNRSWKGILLFQLTSK